MKKQENKSRKEIVIHVTDANQAILGYIGCRIIGDGKMQELQTEKDGTATFEPQPIDTIELFHIYYSDEVSVFDVKGTKDNYFEFTLLPHLGTVYFKDFMLTTGEDELTGGHPLLEKDKIYTYVR
jgi:hypothetical protein